MRPVPPELVEALTDLLDQPVEPHKDVRVRELRKRLRRAYLPWSAQEDDLLLALTQAGFTATELSEVLCRQPGAIQSRLTRHQSPPEPQEERPLPGVQVNRIPASLVAPHFEAWLALVKAGGRVEVVEGNQVVAVLQAPVSVQARRRSKSGPLGASALRPHP